MSWMESWKPRLKEIRFLLYKIRSQPLSLIGMGIVLFYALLALAAPLIVTPNSPDPLRVPKVVTFEPLPPSREYPFGTTGPPTYVDLFYGVIWGTRTSILISITVVGIAVLIGLGVGIPAGFFGGKTDEAVMRITDIFFALPGLVLALVVMSILGRGIIPVIAALSIYRWATYARLVRSETLRVKGALFVEAAEAMGVSKFRILTRHIFPNVIYSAIIVASLDFGSVVLIASSLGFLGLGLEPGSAEWGILLIGSRDWILVGKYWVVFFPGLAIFTFVLGWNLLGDALRDLLDPRTRRLIEKQG